MMNQTVILGGGGGGAGRANNSKGMKKTQVAQELKECLKALASASSGAQDLKSNGMAHCVAFA